jgi:hypothetical protein
VALLSGSRRCGRACCRAGVVNHFAGGVRSFAENCPDYQRWHSQVNLAVGERPVRTANNTDEGLGFGLTWAVGWCQCGSRWCRAGALGKSNMHSYTGAARRGPQRDAGDVTRAPCRQDIPPGCPGKRASMRVPAAAVAAGSAGPHMPGRGSGRRGAQRTCRCGRSCPAAPLLRTRPAAVRRPGARFLITRARSVGAVLTTGSYL